MESHPVATVLLYVEDQPGIQSTMVPVLEDAGFALLVASSGTEALDILETEKGPIDAVMTDVNLGRGPTGWNVARRARRRAASMPILYASSASADEWMVDGVPFSKLVAKPFRPSQVVEVIAALLDMPVSSIPTAHPFRPLRTSGVGLAHRDRRTSFVGMPVRPMPDVRP